MTQFKEFSIEQKKKFAKQFSPQQRAGYRKGQRNGYLKAVFKYKDKPNFKQRTYTKEDFNNLFDDLSKVRWK